MSFIKSPASLRVARYKSLFTSTPSITPNKLNLSNKVQSDGTLTNSFPQSPLSTVKVNTSHEISNNNNLQNGNSSEQCVVRKATSKLDTLRVNLYRATRKPQTATVDPFNFDVREKMKQKQKQERINKIFGHEKKATEFHANPVPKFIKLRSTSRNVNTESNAMVKVPEKRVTKNIEKPGMIALSVPNISTAMLVGPRTLPNRSVTQAQERKQFGEGLKQKEKQRQERGKKQLAIQEQREKAEISRLRKQLVHKAQPIPAYTSRLPEIEKRPLTEPITPTVLKRSRLH